MKHRGIILLFILCLIVQSCIRYEDDLVSEDCNTNCTTVTGRLFTGDGTTPAKGIFATLFWKESSNPIGAFGLYRRKATTVTAENGSFEINFTKREDEINNGSYIIIFKPRTHTNDYFDWLQCSNDIYQILGVDSIGDVNYGEYFLPKKAYLDLSLADGVTLEDDEFIKIRTDWIGAEGEIRYVCSSQKIFNSITSESGHNKTMEVPAEIDLNLNISRTNESGEIFRQDSLKLAAGQRLEYVIDI